MGRGSRYFSHSSSLFITHSVQIGRSTEAAHRHELAYKRVPQPPSEAGGTGQSNKVMHQDASPLVQKMRAPPLPPLASIPQW